MPDESITQERLKELLHYDPDTGLFTWIAYRNNAAKIGDICGRKSNTYVRICINGMFYQAHRLAFLYMEGRFPPEHVDHINHDETDNRWCNLRKVSPGENSKNRRKSSRNTSGVTGVDWHQGKWRVRICSNGKRVEIGTTSYLDEARFMRKAAESKYGFHSNNE